MEYLDFELPLKELKDQLEKCNEIGDERDGLLNVSQLPLVP